jgi:hypothetical protein
MSHVDASGRARDGEQAPCGAGLESSVRVDVEATSFEQRIRVEDSVLPSSGLEVALASEGIIDLAVELERSRCISNQCWSFLNLGGPSSLPSGSRLKVLVQNNLVQSTVLEGLVLHVPLLDDADAALSEVRIINNTIHTLDDPNYGIVFRDGGSCPTIIANNAVGRFSQPLAGVPEGAVLACNQLADSFDPDASSWFVDAAGGDFTPAAPGSPLRDAGCKQWLPELDLFGAPRVTVDIGAIAAEK